MNSLKISSANRHFARTMHYFTSGDTSNGKVIMKQCIPNCDSVHLLSLAVVWHLAILMFCKTGCLLPKRGQLCDTKPSISPYFVKGNNNVAKWLTAEKRMMLQEWCEKWLWVFLGVFYVIRNTEKCVTPDMNSVLCEGGSDSCFFFLNHMRHFNTHEEKLGVI